MLFTVELSQSYHIHMHSLRRRHDESSHFVSGSSSLPYHDDDAILETSGNISEPGRLESNVSSYYASRE